LASPETEILIFTAEDNEDIMRECLRAGRKKAASAVGEAALVLLPIRTGSPVFHAENSLLLLWRRQR
jgi:hypothetical protein